MSAATNLKNSKIAILPQTFDRFCRTLTLCRALAVLTPQNI